MIRFLNKKLIKKLFEKLIILKTINISNLDYFKMTKTYKDPCTFSNPDYFILSHADLDWQIDFDTKVIEATCRLTFQSKGLNLNKTIVNIISFYKFMIICF